VRPIGERACFGCHGTVGAASVSLTTYGAWVTNRNAIRQRVVTRQNMPPNGSSLASADRAVIAAWLGTN
jgi:mono/diheme cytochrome c family protein